MELIVSKEDKSTTRRERGRRAEISIGLIASWSLRWDGLGIGSEEMEVEETLVIREQRMIALRGGEKMGVARVVAVSGDEDGEAGSESSSSGI